MLNGSANEKNITAIISHTHLGGGGGQGVILTHGGGVRRGGVLSEGDARDGV